MKFVVGLALFVALAVSFAAVSALDDNDLDPIIAERLAKAKIREENDRRVQEGFARSQQHYVDTQLAKQAEALRQASLDAEDKGRKDLSREEIERKITSRRFIEEKKKDPSLKTVASTPLIYREIKVGNGKYGSPALTRRINLFMRGVDGTLFSEMRDVVSSVNLFRGTPFLVSIMRAMAEGDRWEVYVPYESAFGERGQRRTRHALHAPLIHAPRADLAVEGDRGLVPVQHLPLHAHPATRDADGGAVPEEGLADALAAMRGLDEDILDIQPMPAGEGAEVREPDALAHRPALDLGQHAEHRGVRAEEGGAEIGLRPHGLVQQLLILRECLDQPEDLRQVRLCRVAE